MTPRPTHVLTLVAGAAGALEPAIVERLREASGGGAPAVLAPGLAADIPLSAAPALDALRPLLAGAPVDLLASTVAHRRKRLLVADMDSTIVTGETLDELAALAGSGEAVAAVTRRSMNGELDFAEALRARVATLAGAPARLLEDVWRGIRLQPGAAELVATMRAAGARCALVSGGFTFFTGRVAALCGFDEHHANVLVVQNGAMTGAVAEPILGRESKRTILRRLAAGLDPAATLATGDGANDLDMLRAAGLAVAFRPKPMLATAIANRVDHADLRALLFAQGFAAGEIRAA